MGTDTRATEPGADPIRSSRKPEHISQVLIRNGWPTLKPHASETPFTEEAETAAPIEECPICRGALWLRYDVPVGDPRFGQIGPCSCNFDAVNEARMQRTFDRAAIPTLYRSAAISDFNKGVVDLVLAAQMASRSVWIHGGTGTGKTHLGVAILKDSLSKRQNCVFVSLADLVEQIKSRFGGQGGDDPFEAACKVDVLVLDDIAAERATTFAVDVFSRLVDYRYNWTKQTIFTSNANPAQLGAEYGGRIVSRLVGVCALIQLTGKDRRMGR